jgi:hypothetical protein
MKKLFFRIAISAVPFTAVSCAFMSASVHAVRRVFNTQQKKQIHAVEEHCSRVIISAFWNITNSIGLDRAIFSFCYQHLSTGECDVPLEEYQAMLNMAYGLDRRWGFCPTKEQKADALSNCIDSMFQESVSMEDGPYVRAVAKAHLFKKDLIQKLIASSVTDYSKPIRPIVRVALDIQSRLRMLLNGDVDREPAIQELNYIIAQLEAIPNNIRVVEYIATLKEVVEALERERPSRNWGCSVQ